MRIVFTGMGLGVLGLVCLMILYSVVVEGDNLAGPGVNIGFGLLKLVLLANLPIWILWLFPPYLKIFGRNK